MAGNHVRISSSFDDKVSNKLAKIRDNFDRLGKSGGFKALAQGVGLGVGQAAFNLLGDAAAGAVGFMQDSIKAASDLNESLSKSRIVFGAAASDIERFGDTAAKAMGLSKQEAIEAAGTFGTFFTGLGEGQIEAAQMSKRLVQLAGDLGSFNNIDPTLVLEKLRAGLTGEAEPLRSVSVFLTEARVKAKAMELGLADAHGELSEGAKVMARYKLILEDTTVQQGDYARTADQLANSQRTATKELRDLQSTLGTQLLPAQLSVTQAQVRLFTNLENFADMLSGKATPGALGMAVALNTMTLEQAKAAFAAQQAATIGARLAAVIGDDSKAASQLKTDLGKTNTVLSTAASRAGRAADKARDLRDAYKTTAESLIDDFYEPVMLHDQLLADRAELRAQKIILASKTATAAEKRDARARIHEIDRDSLTLEVKLLALGKLSKQEQGDLFKRLKEAQRKATGDGLVQINKLIARVKDLIKLGGPGASLSITYNAPQSLLDKNRHRAHGGPVMAGETYTVGEHGPETLVMGNQSGTVIPNGGTRGGTQTINLLLDGAVIASVVNDAHGRVIQRKPATLFDA